MAARRCSARGVSRPRGIKELRPRSRPDPLLLAVDRLLVGEELWWPTGSTTRARKSMMTRVGKCADTPSGERKKRFRSRNYLAVSDRSLTETQFLLRIKRVE